MFQDSWTGFEEILCMGKSLTVENDGKFGLVRILFHAFPALLRKAGEATVGLDTTFTEVATSTP